MKRGWLLFILLGLVVLNGCSAEKFQDNQVYVLDGSAENQADDFVDWIDGEGSDPFQGAAGSLPFELAAGEILLTAAPDGENYYTMQPTGAAGETVLVGDAPFRVIITQVTASSGRRQVVVQDVPFVSKAQWNQTGDIVAFCGGSHLTVYDQQKERLILQEELDKTTISDFFWSPVDNNKMYIEQPDTAGGGLYYVDPEKRVELYETREKIYYRAILENDYYYATQWRSSAKDSDGALYTVLADGQRKVIKIIGRGSYKDSYRKSVLLSGEDRFGLYYVADINQVSKGLTLTEEYVYDAKFITGGKIAYIIQKEQTGANLFVLCICDREGKLIQTLDFSGSSFYLSADGRYGYGSGLMLEIVDLEKAQIIGQAQQTTASANADLLMALRGAVQVYAKMRLGHQATPEDIERYFANSDQAGGMAKAEIWARLPQTHQETAIYYEAILDREHSLMSAEGNFATCHILLIGMDHQGLTFAEELAWDAVKIDGRWQVVGLSTFSREQERTEVLAAVSQFLHAQLPQLASEAITWRQVQYWQKERAGLAGWLNEAEWAKVDADVGGLILWLQRKDGAWQVEQVWYDGGWIYPENAA